MKTTTNEQPTDEQPKPEPDFAFAGPRGGEDDPETDGFGDVNNPATGGRFASKDFTE